MPIRDPSTRKHNKPTHTRLNREDSSLNPTLNYQNLLSCRVPINSIFGFVTRTYKKVWETTNPHKLAEEEGRFGTRARVQGLGLSAFMA